MLFNSLHFLIFFPIVLAAFFALPHRFRWILLVAASYYFYMAFKPEYALILLFLTIVDYWAALLMDRTDDERKRKLYLYGSLVSNLGLLFFFKYFNFFNETIATVLNNFNVFYDSPALKVILPIGISFHVFQSLSYTIDVYRRTRPAERHFGVYALYVSFFPQLVAGPIERSTRLLPQFFEEKKFNPTNFVSGARLMLWGFFMKLVIGDNAGVIVNQVYGDPHSYGGLALALATFFFAVQIFADFAGYSYIAIGSARVMGYDLMENFRRPYFSRSIAEFWRRWHISLMTWFKDYVYISMGGSRVSGVKWIRNILVVFLLSGLWHGANWTFVIWGFLNACYIIIGRYTAPARERMASFVGLSKMPRVYAVLQIFITFVLVCVAWIFFRAESIEDGFYILGAILSGMPTIGADLFNYATLKNVILSVGIASTTQLYSLVFALLVMIVVQLMEEWNVFGAFLRCQRAWVRWSAYYAIGALIVFFGFTGEQPFIYFQF